MGGGGLLEKRREEKDGFRDRDRKTEKTETERDR